MTLQQATAKLHDAAALWSVGYGSGADVVRAACDVVVVGADGQWLAILAGVSLRYPDDELREILPAALGEVGLSWFPGHTDEGVAAALKVLASRVVAGGLPPRELTRWTHSVIGHDGLPLAASLVDLDDVYDTVEYDATSQDLAEVDAMVISEARRITGKANP